jgi:hypothetical protein
MTSPGDDPATERKKERSASDLLLRERAKSEKNGSERISLGELVTGAGPRIYGLALMLLAVPEVIPIPAAGLTGLVAIPLLALAAWMVAFGMEHRLPGWVRRRTLKRSTVEKTLEKIIPWLARLERYSRRRRESWAAAGRPIGVMCFGLGVMMFVPVPFSNVPPAVCVLAIGLGVFRRDGLLVVIAMAAGLTLMIAAAIAAAMVFVAVQD